jgi:hypothetical protein
MSCDEDERPVMEASSPLKEKVERENLYETETAGILRRLREDAR